MDKKEVLKKSLLVGVGLAAHAQEKANKLVNELLKKGHINKSEGKKLVSKVAVEAKKSGERIAKVCETELKKVLKTAKMK